METKRTVKPYPGELRERSVRMVQERAQEHASEWAAIRSVAAKVGRTAETLRQWVRQAERDRGVQYLSFRYTDRLADAGIVSSVGSVGDSYDNAPTETVIGLFKAELIRSLGPWRSLEAVEIATIDWTDWFNTRRRSNQSVTSRPPRQKTATTPNWRHGMSRHRTQANPPPGNPARFGHRPGTRRP